MTNFTKCHEFLVSGSIVSRQLTKMCAVEASTRCTGNAPVLPGNVRVAHFFEPISSRSINPFKKKKLMSATFRRHSIDVVYGRQYELHARFCPNSVFIDLEIDPQIEDKSTVIQNVKPVPDEIMPNNGSVIDLETNPLMEEISFKQPKSILRKGSMYKSQTKKHWYSLKYILLRLARSFTCVFGFYTHNSKKVSPLESIGNRVYAANPVTADLFSVAAGKTDVPVPSSPPKRVRFSKSGTKTITVERYNHTSYDY